jgi:hypothetical protein
MIAILLNWATVFVSTGLIVFGFLHFRLERKKAKGKC